MKLVLRSTADDVVADGRLQLGNDPEAIGSEPVERRPPMH
jgi:hypothetical protein